MSSAGIPEKTRSIITFFVKDTLCAIDLLETQEIIKTTGITPVPLAPDHVTGIINLRGSIVTVIDLQIRLGLSQDFHPSPGTCCIIVSRLQEESIGLKVSGIGNVLEISDRDMAPPPANLQESHGRFVSWVVRHEQGLIVLLDLPSVLA
jgi:purine-binding chemotaxis protein CheW